MSPGSSEGIPYLSRRIDGIKEWTKKNADRIANRVDRLRRRIQKSEDRLSAIESFLLQGPHGLAWQAYQDLMQEQEGLKKE